MDDPPQPQTARRLGRYLAVATILFVATALRGIELGRLSLWYDEVVTMRLAREPDPAQLLSLLGRIDATRAPLHPLLLQGWIAVFGPSDVSGRAFSAVCGVLTVALVYGIGRSAFDDRSGLWASWLCAVSPLMVQYSREARMYAWLALVTCLAWWLLLSFLRAAPAWKRVAYGVSLIALSYSHPLGLLMIAALGLAYWLNRRAFLLSWRGWLAIHLGLALAIAPWVGRYVDHAPESTVGRLPWRFLLGLPIGFIGGDSRVLAVCIGLIALGLLRVGRRDVFPSRAGEEGRGPLASRIGLDHPTATTCLLTWLVVPPVVLYVYSRLSHPIFGPARYTLFVGPAYLLLVARGLAKLPWPVRWLAVAAGLVLATMQLDRTVYAPELKADWRAVGEMEVPVSDFGPVIVVSSDTTRNVEVETARYYLGQTGAITPEQALTGHWERQGAICVIVPRRADHPLAPVPEAIRRRWPRLDDVRDVPGLRLYFRSVPEPNPP